MKKKIYFLILIVLALFCLVNCAKDNNSQSMESTSKELENLKKPIDFMSLTFDEAQQKLIDAHIADFSKDMEVIEGMEERNKVIDWVVEHYYRKTQNGEILSGGSKQIYLKKGTKEGFSGKIIYRNSLPISHIEEYIKNGTRILRISYGNGTYIGNNNCLNLLDDLYVEDNKLNQISYDFRLDYIDENYAKENGITVDKWGNCPMLIITERMNDVIIKRTYYFYDLNSKKPVTNYEEILTENLEYLKTTEMVYEEK